MILLVRSNDMYENDFRGMLQAFFPWEKIFSSLPSEAAGYSRNLYNEITMVFSAIFDEGEVTLRIEEKGHVIYSAIIYGDHTDKKIFRNRLKKGCYRLLSDYTGKGLPWGSLTGMRPTKIATKCFDEGKSRDEVVQNYIDSYDCSPKKAELATSVAIKERQIIDRFDTKQDYMLYIGIPFCPSRCTYCSFASYPIDKFESEVKYYIDALIRELQNISLQNFGRTLKGIYIGGGTPTAISARELERLLIAIETYFDISRVEEFTVEAGRPDSITLDKLRALKRQGVTRISINPQTMVDETLHIIGRNHTVKDIYRAFDLARGQGFNNINADIIVGLPKETPEDMKVTLNGISFLAPESLTIHSLAVKRASGLKEAPEEVKVNPYAAEMMDMATDKAYELGLSPYYLYRQRNIAGNLENVGFAKKKSESIYNVMIIEEKIDIMAAGAGAVTKLIYPNFAKIERIEDCKSITDYIGRIDEMIDRKRMAIETRNMAAAE